MCKGKSHLCWNRKGYATAYSKSQPLTIAIIPGDGIGKEVIPVAERLLKSVAKELVGSEDALSLLHLEAGWESFQKSGNALPSETLKSLQKCEGALFGAVSSPTHKVEGYSSPIIGMRKALDLYANLRPNITMPVEGAKRNVNMYLVRENTECLYVKRERLEDNGNTAIAERVITRKASTRIADLAFKIALKRKAMKSPLVTIVHKSNVLGVSDGLFRECCFEVAKKYPEVKTEEQIVDSMVYKMILEPQRYNVIVAPNLYGDILSDAAAALTGGLGIAPSANVSDKFSLCEPVHGSAPDIAGKGIANPVAAVRALALLLERFPNGDSIAAAIEEAAAFTVRRGPNTPDLGGSATTTEVGNALVERTLEIIQREKKKNINNKNSTS